MGCASAPNAGGAQSGYKGIRVALRLREDFCPCDMSHHHSRTSTHSLGSCECHVRVQHGLYAQPVFQGSVNHVLQMAAIHCGTTAEPVYPVNTA